MILAWLRFVAVFLVFFFPVYLGAGALTALWPERVMQLHLPWEPDIPMVPWMVWPYLSLYSVYLLPLFHMNPEQMRRLTWQSVAAVLVAGITFLALPAMPSYPLRGQRSDFMLKVIDLIDTPYNTMPSLHVACAALILLGCGERASRPLRTLYLVWLTLLAVSTVLVHQHHLVDLASGFLLAVAIRRVLPLDAAPARP
jgi:membrane-associated phospholipid phosphatase